MDFTQQFTSIKGLIVVAEKNKQKQNINYLLLDAVYSQTLTPALLTFYLTRLHEEHISSCFGAEK